MTDTQLSLKMAGAPTPAEPDVNSQMLAPPAGWPEPPAVEAYHGVFGAIIEKLAPNTEADPVAILAQLLVASAPRSVPAPTSKSKRPAITPPSSCCSPATAPSHAKALRSITSRA